MPNDRPEFHGNRRRNHAALVSKQTHFAGNEAVARIRDRSYVEKLLLA
jgi:hypothetical protein